MRRRRGSWLLALLVGAFPAGALALEIREGFEWDWSPLCVEAGTQPSSCFAVAGCENARPLFVRRTNPGTCDYSEQVRFWVGRESGANTPSPPRALADAGHRWSASHVRDPGLAEPNGDTFEILSTREKQSARFGSMQVDFHVPNDVPVTGAGEHYLIMHNLNLSRVVPCTSDGTACGDDVTSSVGGVPEHPGSYEWYGVIAGAFGAGTKAIPYGSVGFTIEVSAQGRGGNHLIDESFVPYSVDGAQESFPAGTYRLRIWRGDEAGVDTYGYSVLRWDGDVRRWLPIVPDTKSGNATGHEVRVPFSKLVDPIGFEIAPGYVGLTAAWFGAPTPEFRRIDWDNLIVDW